MTPEFERRRPDQRAVGRTSIPMKPSWHLSYWVRTDSWWLRQPEDRGWRYGIPRRDRFDDTCSQHGLPTRIRSLILQTRKFSYNAFGTRSGHRGLVLSVVGAW